MFLLYFCICLFSLGRHHLLILNLQFEIRDPHLCHRAADDEHKEYQLLKSGILALERVFLPCEAALPEARRAAPTGCDTCHRTPTPGEGRPGLAPLRPGPAGQAEPWLGGPLAVLGLRPFAAQNLLLWSPLEKGQ